MDEKAFQDFYPDELACCYGCGRFNDAGLHVRSFWEGDEAVCRFEPGPHHIAIPGVVYGGLLASVIDCHGIGTAAAAMYRFQGRPMGSEPALRFVTASLHVDYLRPTPAGATLEVRARVKEIKGRKVVVEETLFAAGEACARGTVIAVLAPDHLFQSRA